MFTRILFAIAIFLTPFSAYAQGNCIPRDVLVQKLKELGEEPKAFAMAKDNKAIIEIWQDRRSNWTMFLSLPNGMSCGVAVGESGWVFVEGEPA